MLRERARVSVCVRARTSVVKYLDIQDLSILSKTTESHLHIFCICINFITF